MTIEMTSSKSYLIKAYYDWIMDNDLTPYIAVDVNVYGVLVPMAYVSNGQIILNVSPGAVGHIALGQNDITFSARFGGKLEHMVVPYGAIAAIYAKENGVGSGFEIEHPVSEEDSSVLSPVAPSPKLNAADQNDEKNSDHVSEKPKVKGKPTLTVIK